MGEPGGGGAGAVFKPFLGDFEDFGDAGESVVKGWSASFELSDGSLCYAKTLRNFHLGNACKSATNIESVCKVH